MEPLGTLRLSSEGESTQMLGHLQALGAYLSALYQLEADVGGPLDQ